MADAEEIGSALGSSQITKDPDWERKQRNREYRVAARREKRNRKADEKKQRKLNATILRRMTRNPDKYNKNAERNRLRDIEGERRKIWQEAVRQAQRLAAIHDPSGVSFNVGPVVIQEDGTVISQEILRRREENAKDRAAAKMAKEGTSSAGDSAPAPNDAEIPRNASLLPNGLNPERLTNIELAGLQQPPPKRLSKTQQKKRAALEPRSPPPKPTLPEGVDIPEREERWLDLWDLSDDQLERRVLREKKRKAAERKALRIKQQTGKAERRIARDEKRKVYRDIKLTWKAIKEEQVRERTKLKSMEDEESKKIAVDINILERKAALDHCSALGFTLANTAGVDEIKPRALGMKGVEVDFDAIEVDESRSGVKPKTSNKRVNLGDAPEEARAEYVPNRQADDEDDNGDVEEFIQLDIGEGQDFETLNYNHKLRRKLRRAIDNAEIRKEMLVRERAVDYYRDKDSEIPSVLTTPYKPLNVKGQRILDNGRLETAKQERVRARLELAEFNTQMRILRKQAKDAAIYAGLRKHAELMGRIASSEELVNQEESAAVSQIDNDDEIEAPEDTSLAAPALHTMKLAKRNRIDSDESSSYDLDKPSEKKVKVSKLSDTSFNVPTPPSSNIGVKISEGVESGICNKQSESTNSDRQALIDAESAHTKFNKYGEQKVLNASRSLKEVDANASHKFRRGGLGKGANSILPTNGDAGRKTKFLRLLGAGKSMPIEGHLECTDGSPDNSTYINAVLEKQYEDGIAYGKNSRRTGIGL